MATRPNPDQLLAQIQDTENAENRAKFKIFLGAAPGVGKTYAMLEEARAKLKEGVDVVVGIVETHKRQETESMLVGFEILPRISIPYQNRNYLEFDIDAALHRAPQLLLLDEMAHTNIPGSRHEKRWQDIKELLDRGIHVYTTLNVQHIESVNDVVAQITGTTIRETVPDSMLQLADSIELVDLPPEDLLKRLQEGKVYIPEQAEFALQNFFKKSNLTALRELALRMTAERVNEQMLSQRKLSAAEKPWAVSERLLVIIGKDPKNARLIRTAYRLASPCKTHWIVIYADHNRRPLLEKQKDVVLQNLRLAEQLGAETQWLHTEHSVQDILNFAKERNVTQIIVSKPSSSRWKTWLFGSFVEELIRASGEIDVRLIRNEKKEEAESSDKNAIKKTKKTDWDARNYWIAFLVVSFCTAFNFLFASFLKLGNMALFYLLGIVFVASRGKRGPSIFAAILAPLVFDYFFVPPKLSMWINQPSNVVMTLIMLAIAQIVSYLSVGDREALEMARLREQRTAALYSLSRRLAETRGTDAVLQAALQSLSEIFDGHIAIFLPDDQQRLDVAQAFPNEISISSKERSVAYWVFDLGQPAGAGTQTLTFSKATYVPLRAADDTRIGVLRVEPNDPKRFLLPEQLHLLEALASQIALALEVDRLQQESV